MPAAPARTWRRRAASDRLAQRPSTVAVDTRTGHAFVATGGAGEPGHVSMVDTATGALLRTVPVGLDPIAMAVDERAGRVVVVNHDSGSVSVLDARSGAIVNTVRVGPLPMRWPWTSAVDAPSSRTKRVV